MNWIIQQSHQQLEQLPLPLRRLSSLQFPWFWQSFLGFWHLPSGEPRVREKRDRNGNLYWQVYDPGHDETVYFDDEPRLLTWLDEQHYRKSRPTPWNIDY